MKRDLRSQYTHIAVCQVLLLLHHTLPPHASLQFYEATRCLLPSLINLLQSFMGRSHHSLAAVGVAAFVRLCSAAGPHMTEPDWAIVTQVRCCVLVRSGVVCELVRGGVVCVRPLQASTQPHFIFPTHSSKVR